MDLFRGLNDAILCEGRWCRQWRRTRRPGFRARHEDQGWPLSPLATQSFLARLHLPQVFRHCLGCTWEYRSDILNLSFRWTKVQGTDGRRRLCNAFGDGACSVLRSDSLARGW